MNLYIRTHTEASLKTVSLNLGPEAAWLRSTLLAAASEVSEKFYNIFFLLFTARMTAE